MQKHSHAMSVPFIDFHFLLSSFFFVVASDSVSHISKFQTALTISVEADFLWSYSFTTRGYRFRVDPV